MDHSEIDIFFNVHLFFTSVYGKGKKADYTSCELSTLLLRTWEQWCLVTHLLCGIWWLYKQETSKSQSSRVFEVEREIRWCRPLHLTVDGYQVGKALLSLHKSVLNAPDHILVLHVFGNSQILRTMFSNTFPGTEVRLTDSPSDFPSWPSWIYFLCSIHQEPLPVIMTIQRSQWHHLVPSAFLSATHQDPQMYIYPI